MTDYVQQEATPNLLLRELLDLDERIRAGRPMTSDEAVQVGHKFRQKFMELHKYLKGGGQFPREWVTKRNQYTPDEWRQR